MYTTGNHQRKSPLTVRQTHTSTPMSYKTSVCKQYWNNFSPNEVLRARWADTRFQLLPAPAPTDKDGQILFLTRGKKEVVKNWKRLKRNNKNERCKCPRIVKIPYTCENRANIKLTRVEVERNKSIINSQMYVLICHFSNVWRF